MNSNLFERLMYEEESTTLDFKREQYQFAKATEDQKSELLKDILGFANAWRRSEAFILIGVQDVRGGRGEIIGIPITDHLDDHSLQQFVNNLTNRPVHFQYEAFGIEGKQVGIIRIENQPRPFYLKKDYGKLKYNEVYVRRGSSTDPTKPATPEEIAQMGRGKELEHAEVVVEFADMVRDNSLGGQISWDAEFCALPPAESIPNFARRRHGNPLGLDMAVSSIMDQPNSNYFRELAKYEFFRRLFRPVRLIVFNSGQVVANNVRTELTIPTKIGVEAREHKPTAPRRTWEIAPISGLGGLRSMLNRPVGEVDIDTNSERTRIVIDCGSLQPQRRVWSDVFYVGISATGDVLLNGQIFADNLPAPKEFNLTVSANITQTKMTVEELCSLPQPQEDRD